MDILQKLREATEGSEYEGRLFLVGGIVRDKVMGLLDEEDVDIVMEGDATRLAKYLREKGIAEHEPVVYPKFGTAMVTVLGRQVELVSARTETYKPTSRKPEVQFASLREDVLRRDFTINTLLENLHTGEILDLLGTARRDIDGRVIRTPAKPESTFAEDPLRMLRAVRFASRFDFALDQQTYDAIVQEAERLSIISKERIRDEFTKIVMSSGAIRGLELLRESGLLSQFAPELLEMYGATQNVYHIYDVWTHTMKALEHLPPDSDLLMRLATLFHDIGKPRTRTVDDNGNVHFYSHQMVGADMARRIMGRLRFSKDETERVVRIISLHLRVGEYDSAWSDAAVRRMIREVGDLLPDLVTLTKVDKAASNLEMPSVDLGELEERMAQVMASVNVAALRSPINGKDIMATLGVKPGPILRQAKDFLTSEVVEGRLQPDDKEGARQLLREKFLVDG